MPNIKLNLDDQIGTNSVSYARKEFIRFCELKNLVHYTIKYYQENIDLFLAAQPQIKRADEITQETVNNYIMLMMDRGNRVTAINARLRALFVFFRFCFEREYTAKFPLTKVREDESIKEPYTDEELQKLLKMPQSKHWAEWRSWAVINLLIATGIRANTVVNIKISDVDLEYNLIRLRKLKNRKQQIIPISSSLRRALELYLQIWDGKQDSYLFPAIHHEQLQAHTLEESIRKYNISRGVSKTSTHLFRHTFAKHYILAGGSMIQLQSILGHSTLDMTRRYINLYGTEIHRDFDRLNPLNRMMEKVEQET